MPRPLKLTPSDYHNLTTGKKSEGFRLSEHEVQRQVFEWARGAVQKYPELALLYAVPNGFPLGSMPPHLRYSIVNYMKASGLKPGVPDMVLPVPRNRFHSAYVEQKVGKGRSTPEQQKWLLDLAAQGHYTAVSFSYQDTITILTEYLEMRGAIW